MSKPPIKVYIPPSRLIQFGPSINVQVGLSINRNTESSPALIDTGAAISCIDDYLARSLNLPVIDHGTVSGIAGATQVNFYLALVYIPDLDDTIVGPFAGVHLAAGGQVHRVLLGRTFLHGMIFQYQGDGHLQLASVAPPGPRFNIPRTV